MAPRSLIAIVDDNRYVREGLDDLVRSLGYVTASFASADQYLSSGRVEETVCLITDLQMPDMTGADLQDRLIAHGLDIPVIFVTASDDESARARVLGAGAIGFLSKPFDVQWLRGHLAEAVRRKSPSAEESAASATPPEWKRVERKRGRWPPVMRAGGG